MRLDRRFLPLLHAAATISAWSFPMVVSSSRRHGRGGTRARYGFATFRSPVLGSAEEAPQEEAATSNAPAAGSELLSQTLSSSCSTTQVEGSTGSIRVTATHRPSHLRERQPVCEYHEISVSPPPPATTTTTPLTEPKPEQQQGATPQQVISTRDLTPTLKKLILQSGISHGTLTVLSRHTTTSIVINEHESRLAQDVAKHLLHLAPIDERSAHPLRREGVRYLHNDIDQRPDSAEEFQRCLDNGYDVRDPDILQQWRDQEPINAHSHLLSMLLGSSESIPIVNGTLVIGQWQSVLLVDLDGPRTRTVGVNLVGYR
jgi:thiamine phosphate synthase YjbQ (UPF0047 family)